MTVPERFEFGTLPYELMAGVSASIDYVAALDSSASGSRRERIVKSIMGKQSGQIYKLD